MQSLVFSELLKGFDLSSLVDNDVDLKMDDFNQNALLMSPPASDTGSQAGFSPYSIDSEPGSPLLDDAKVVNILEHSTEGSVHKGCMLLIDMGDVCWMSWRSCAGH